ncbi:hypothetical protein C922_05648 [Plasmodium inui San Antonio 1]|uniref:Uncharacterized protein n=1 Tax=Plasmodium inui San Antonio 1 TaxID=1237626 RepID=W7A4D4_9APIC|nr:hypothetical protein C922_05648 [Plasmodium inui San Antonio 1]EUD63969.1 hypothetical protein C922_05648 [Plasmodium inui San Antonio 1]
MFIIKRNNPTVVSYKYPHSKRIPSHNRRRINISLQRTPLSPSSRKEIKEIKEEKPKPRGAISETNIPQRKGKQIPKEPLGKLQPSQPK